MTLKEEIEALERRRVEEHLKAARGVISDAAISLGLSVQGLHNKIERYAIVIPRQVCPTCNRVFPRQRSKSRPCKRCQRTRVLNSEGICRFCVRGVTSPADNQDAALRTMA